MDNSTSQRPPTITTGNTFEVHRNGRVIDTARLAAALRAEGNTDHYYVVSILFQQADPEVAMDDMECGPQNLVGTNGMFCLWCHQRYRTPDDPGPVCPGGKE
jgi:hypothetical protein